MRLGPQRRPSKRPSVGIHPGISHIPGYPGIPQRLFPYPRDIDSHMLAPSDSALVNLGVTNQGLAFRV